ncbi:phosphotransferase enzyme family protein [Ornithinibacillus salinisoli]|uniref:Phosphotransferase enzyme family protein n=1 Tax=Ornithinibacillus salinisoli TaxID=1848459 RepID=A0ABW4W4H7_9BACI
MERIVEQVFTKEVMDQAIDRFSVQKEYKKLGDFENYVFEVYKKDTPYILRITHSSHRSEEEVISELDWMNYLYRAGVNVPRTYESVDGLHVVTIPAEDGSFFYCSLFSKAKGEPIRVNDERFNSELFFAWGKAIGKMHYATKTYVRNEKVTRRPYWHEDDLIPIENYISKEEETVIQNTKQLINQLIELPQTKENFGLLHTDIHSGNFFFDGSEIHIFDFDDCCYHWFCSDIAIPLYYSVLYRYPQGERKIRNEFAIEFIQSFMEGYKTENEPPEQWKNQIGLFFRLRDIMLYSVLHKKIPQEERSEKINALLAELKARIEKEETIVDVV